MSETLARIRAKRAGNRGVMTKLSNEADALLMAETVDKQRLKIISDSLNDKLKLVKTFDEEILENCAVDEIENEIEESDEVNSRMEDLLRVIQKATSSKETNAGVSTAHQQQIPAITSALFLSHHLHQVPDLRL